MTRLEHLTIPAPCPAQWDAMHGDERSRHCSACGKSVVNIEAFTAFDVECLLRRFPGEVCARLARDAAGAVVTAEPRRRGRFGATIGSLMTVVAGVAAALGLVRVLPEDVKASLGLKATPKQVTYTLGLLQTRQGGETTSADDY